MSSALPSRRYWWIEAIAGVLAILFGIAAILWPGLTFNIFLILFGGYVTVDGVLRFADAFWRMIEGQTWWPTLVIGIIGIAVGLYLLTNPAVLAVVAVYVVAFWAIVVGSMDIIRGVSSGQFSQSALGVITILFGLVLLANPSRGPAAVALIVGAYAIVRGILLLIDAFRPHAATTTPS